MGEIGMQNPAYRLNDRGEFFKEKEEKKERRHTLGLTTVDI